MRVSAQRIKAAVYGPVCHVILCVGAAGAAAAQTDYPNKPIRLLVGSRPAAGRISWRG